MHYDYCLFNFMRSLFVNLEFSVGCLWVRIRAKIVPKFTWKWILLWNFIGNNLKFAYLILWHRLRNYFFKHSRNVLNRKTVLTYSPSYNLISPISPVLICQHLIFCSITSPTCCNSPWKCTPVKYKKRQKAGFPIVT